MGERVVIADKLAANGVAMLKSTSGLDVIETVGKGPEALRDALLDAAALIVRSETQVTQGADEPWRAKLRVVARAGIGTDNIDLEEASRPRHPGAHRAGGQLDQRRRAYRGADAERCARKVPQAAALDGRRHLGPQGLRGHRAARQDAGHPGPGPHRHPGGEDRPGVRHERDRARPVTSSRRTRCRSASSCCRWTQVLARADILTLHIALTDETRGLLDAARLARTKKGVLIVNTARGALIDDAALVEGGQVGPGGRRGARRVRARAAAEADSVLRKACPTSSSRRIWAPRPGRRRPGWRSEIAEAVRDALLAGDLRSAVNLGGLDAKHVAASKPLMDLGERLGRLAFVLSAGARRSRWTCAISATDDRTADTAGIAALKGVLAGHRACQRVSLVNAAHLARQRGIRVTRQHRGSRRVPARAIQRGADQRPEGPRCVERAAGRNAHARHGGDQRATTWTCSPRGPCWWS